MAKTVLVVEDNPLNMELFRDLLINAGYEVLSAGDGSRALDLARTRPPDLVLMDIQLPGVSGLEVTRWLKDDPALSSIPVIAVTAFAMRGDEARIRQCGCEAYLAKPISAATLLATVAKFLETKPI